MIHISPGPGFNRYWIDPQLIGADGRANPAFLLPPTTPGEQGQLIYLRTPSIWNLDASLGKTFPIAPNGGSMTIFLTSRNVLNHPILERGRRADRRQHHEHDVRPDDAAGQWRADDSAKAGGQV